MALSFLSGQQKARTQITAIDIGARTTKAVQIQKKGEGYALSNFALLDSPIFEKVIPQELLVEHLKAINLAMDGSVKNVSFILGVGESVFRPAEMPFLPLDDLRAMLKFGSKNYLQQDLPDHVFDCHILSAPPPATEGVKGQPAKCKLLVGAGRRDLVGMFQNAGNAAGMFVEQIVPGVVGPPNALELAMPEVFQNEVVAVVDIGFRNTTISLLVKGELVLNRVVNLGGDRLTSGLAEAMSVSYAEAEGIKVGLSAEVEMLMQTLLMPLGQELRASINFFEHQQDKTVTQVLVSGGSARSDFILQALQGELMVACARWNPLAKMNLALPPRQTGEIEAATPQLAVAIGGALAAF